MRDKLILFIAQGFGIGRIPFAPGTWGSVLGIGWFLLLLLPGSKSLFLLGTLVGLAASVWFCGEAEKILKQSDPGSVVIDEIAAMPICFLVWFTKGFPKPEHFFHGNNWLWLVGVFLAFRLFDIWKPWPVRGSQKLPGGWGVTVDDALAAVYVNVVLSGIISFFAA